MLRVIGATSGKAVATAATAAMSLVILSATVGTRRPETTGVRETEGAAGKSHWAAGGRHEYECYTRAVGLSCWKFRRRAGAVHRVNHSSQEVRRFVRHWGKCFFVR